MLLLLSLIAVISFVFLPFKLLLWAIVISAVISIAWYLHLKNRTSYFAKKGIPTPKFNHLYLGHLPEYEKNDKEVERLSEWEKECGDTYGIYEGSHKVLVSSDIDLINDVFVKQFHQFRSRKLFASSCLDQEHGKGQNLFLAEGNRWKRLRSLISSCLTIKQIIGIEPIMNNVMDKMMNSIDEKYNGSKNGVIDVKPDLMMMGFGIIKRVAFGVDEDFNKSDNLMEMLEAFQTIKASRTWRGYFFAGTYEFLMITKYINLLSLVSTVGKILKMRGKMIKLLKERENESEVDRNSRPKDMIDYLQESCIDDDEIQDRQKSVLDIKVQKKLTQDELASTCMMFLIAGTDTTANTTTFFLYDLARNKSIQERIIEEIDMYITSDEDITYHKIKELDLLDRAIKESGRLHPLGTTLTARRAREDTIITKSDGTKITIERGTCFMPNVMSVHLNEKIWGPNPEEFDPDRFLPEYSVDRPGVAWLGFGYGPRMCPGYKLAMHEVKLAAIRILKEYTVDICDETNPEFFMRTILTVNSMKLKFTKRF